MHLGCKGEGSLGATKVAPGVKMDLMNYHKQMGIIYFRHIGYVYIFKKRVLQKAILWLLVLTASILHMGPRHCFFISFC